MMERTGMLVSPFSHKEFARKLGLLMKDEELRMEMSKNCVQYVRRFDIQNVADEWERTFGRLKSTAPSMMPFQYPVSECTYARSEKIEQRAG